MAWTTADLLTSIKTRAMLPDASTGSYSSASLLNFATEELLLTLVGMILGCREKYFETSSSTTITANTGVLAIPARAIGGVISAVLYTYNNVVRQLQPISPPSITTTSTAASPTNFYFQNNSIVLYPTPSVDFGTIILRYFQRPNRLEQTSNCAQITAFDAVAMTATCSGGVPSTWGNGTAIDFIPQTASQATPYGLNSNVTGVTGSVVTFTALPVAVAASNIPGPAIGDWLAPAEYTPIPEIPFEFQVVLAQATACKALEAGGDREGLAAAQAQLQAYIRAAVLVMTPRDQGGLKKVVAPWRRY